MNTVGRDAAAALCFFLLGVTAPTAPVGARHVMVVTDQHYASRVGLDVLRSDGNAVDAAVAVGYALAVVDPCCGNIGGGGFMLIRFSNGKETFIDFREKAPFAARPKMFLDARGNVVPNASTKSFLSVGVPGTVAGLEYARRRYGTLSRAQLLAPAIALARDGYVLDTGDVRVFNSSLNELDASPVARAVFTRSGKSYAAGARLRQPQLALTLKAIARDGAAAFYRGRVAREIVAASRTQGGVLTLRDFANYRVDESAPIHCRYHGYDIASAPPPSSGGATMCEILDIVGAFPLQSYGWNSARSIHDMVEAERRAFADRNTYLGDPAFAANPIGQLLSSQYATKLRSQIMPDRATPSAQISGGLGPPQEHRQTTHYSIVDRWGNAVALTYTINDTFGSDLIAGDTGFLLNDEMDDFTVKAGAGNLYGLVQGERNEVQPAKRPLSSMAPTMVTKDGKLFMVAGSPGGARIITITLGILQNVIDYGMNIQAAVDAPRFHHQWLPDEIQIEPNAIKSADRLTLQAMGYRLKEYAPWGSAQAILVDPTTGTLYGGTDRRRSSGAALGY